ncbi:hypothetical protein N7486_004883 [Penicillium sp. IBT 16267x]|nr:hypothetical protein N7486_004883 [Penicillium sp. IBT 16267x]
MLYNIWADFAKIVVTASIVIVITALLVRRRQPLESSKPKRLTFRVDNIPINETKELEHNIKSFAKQDPDLQRAVATIVCHRLTPRDKRFVCATVSITTSLSGEDLCARLRRTSKSYLYSFTCRFDGITPLYEDESGADVDIIAVPGLGSHALGSWKSTDSDEVWLRDFLPRDLPNVRVLLYGYDTTLPGSLSKQSIEDLGSALLEQITAFRANDSLLIRARRRRSTADSDLSQACFGLLFFGVPNLGLRNEQLRTLVQGQPNKALVDDLLVDNDSEPSTFLKRLADQFSESCKGYYRVVTFFERTLSPTLELAQDGNWSKTGRPSLLVTEKSATGTGLVAVIDEDNIPLNTDHSGLVKYSSRSQGDYTIVRERLRRFVSEAKAEVAKRFAEHYLYQPLSETMQACLKSLAFDEMESRQFEVEAATAGTCKWLLSHETLIHWTRQHRGLLWIRGKPGSGKSTLMKYALQEIPAIYDTDAVVVSFFFHGRGHELQRTPLGLYRSLIHQLLKRVPGALTDLIDYFEDQRKTIGEPGDKWKWELQQLQTFLKSSLARILKTCSVVLCIDALDECGEELAVKLINDLEHLRSSLPSTDSRFGICFSCREYPILDLSKGLIIVLHEENNADIAAFVQDRFSASDMDARIREIICIRAQGVFLWAYLVVQRLLGMKRNREPKGKIEAEIGMVPQSLDALYCQLIQGMRDRPDALKMIQWICFSTRPLTTVELQWSMAIDADGTHKSLEECCQSDDFIADEDIDTRIKVLSWGLAEIITSTNARIVQFIHQSVKDFFIERGLLILSETKEIDLIIPAAHCGLSRSCIRYLRMAVVSQSGSPDWRNKSEFPLLHYATTSWIPHMKLGKVDVDVKDTESGRTPLSWAAENGHDTIAKMLLDTGKVDVDMKDLNGRTPLSWAAENSHDTIVKMLLDTGKVDVDASDTEYGRTPLSWAAKNGHDTITKMLLNTGKVDVDASDTENDQTPLSWATENGHDTIVKMLLDTGKVDVDTKDSRGRTPLLWAAMRGHDTIFKMLLNTGKVDVDMKDSRGRTPLLWAAMRGHDTIFKMLLDTGKVDVDMKDSRGRTPLLWAAMRGHDTIFKMLLDTGKVDVDASDTKYGQTPLLWAAKNGHDTIFKMLLDTDKVDVDTKDSNGRTPLSWAAENGHDTIVKMLLDTGNVDVDASDTEYGRTPLSWAAENGHDTIVKMLLDTGNVDVDASDTEYGRTPLSWAAQGGHDAVVKILLDTGGTSR